MCVEAAKNSFARKYPREVRNKTVKEASQLSPSGGGAPLLVTGPEPVRYLRIWRGLGLRPPVVTVEAKAGLSRVRAGAHFARHPFAVRPYFGRVQPSKKI